MTNFKKYICTLPFTSMELHEDRNFMCCPSWLLKELPGEVPLSELWNSDEAIDIRKSVMDGSYRNCDKEQCPYLSQLINTGNIWDGPIQHIESLPKYIRETVDSENGVVNYGPQIIQMSFDRTCNYHCPSCRKELIVADNKKINKINKTIEEIEINFGKDLKWIYVTGSGDPFVSISFRDFLRNFDSNKFPQLINIHLHTNASKWNEKMWNSMNKIHKYVRTCEISIDAGTKETYENVTRLGGNWDVLMDNLKFINTIPKLQYVKTSFVVQQSNYKEMTTFVNLVKNIFGEKVKVFFGKINNWGAYTDEEYKNIKVWDESHPEFLEFKKEFNKVCFDDQVYHNMHEFMDINKKLI